MGNELTQQAYSQAVGTTSTNYPWIDTRDPTQYDIYYPIGKFWINRGAARLWYLNAQSNASGQLLSTWELISVSSLLVSISDNGNTPVFPSSNAMTPPDNIQLVAGSGISIVGTPASHLITISSTGTFESLQGNDGVPVAPVLGIVQTLGNTVGNGIHGQPLYTFNPSAGVEQWDIQVAAAIASSNINLTGLAAFSNAQFAVDGNGFVTLAGGGGPPTLGLIPDAHTAPGTSPVTPNGSGNIKLEGGATYGTGLQANPIRTNSLAADTIDFQIQLAGSHAGSSTANNFGVAQFDANQFTVTSGFVQIIGGGTTGAVTSLTGNDSVQVFPLAGNINVKGTGSITVTGTANTETISLTGLTANAVLYGLGTATVGLVASGTTGQVLQTNTSAAPTWSTATYPSTTTINQILYSSSNNTVTGLATTAGSVLSTSSAGVPTWLGPLTNGQIIIGSTGAIPVASTLTAGTGITITNGAGSISIAATGAGSVLTLTGNSGGAISPSAGNINTVGTGSITIVGSGSTLTTELTGLTNHNVLIGAGSATITNVAPSATPGVPLISQGSMTDPAFGTAVVAGGGTGNTTFTAYAVITAGTTATGAFQNVVGLGTSGQVLTSQGAGALPVWTNTGTTNITLNGDSGSATGSTITITGGTTGLTTSGAASTLTLTGTLNVGHGGTGATTLTGILTGTGTTAIVGTAITQYNVLTAGASNLPNSVAPSATPGVPLISAGTSAQPTFGTAVVAGGGTGNTTFTAYSVITAGTTATGAFQNVVGVGSSGQVLTSNGAAALLTWQSVGVNTLSITMDAGTTPISPTADALVFTGGQIAASSTANVIRTDGSAANAMTIQIQRSTTSGSSTPAANGVSHFNSTQFSVDSNAFVTSNNITFVAGSGISLSPATGLVTLGGTLTIASTGTGITWQTIVASQTLVADNGYFCISPGGALALALPTSGATIGTTIEVVLDGATSWSITQAAGQQVRFGNSQTTSGASGSLASTRQGDSVRLVCETANDRWVVVSSVGSITVT